MRKAAALFLIYFTVVLSSFAEDSLSTGGHLKYQGSYLDDISGGGSGELNEVDGRLKAHFHDGGWSFDIHAQLLAAGSSRTFTSLLGERQGDILPADRLRLARLTSKFSDSGHGEGEIRSDRLSATYTAEIGSVTVGRQAYSLGNGLTFSVMDVLNPFSPVAIDKDYKPGDDLVLLKLHLLSLGDTDIIVAPKRRLDDGKLESDSSSGLINQKMRIDSLSVDSVVLAGSQEGHLIYGIGASRDFLGATLRSDIVMHHFNDSDQKVSFLVNADRGFECFNRNCYGFLEFFHSGVGSTSDGYYLPNKDRDYLLSYGELYTLGKNYTSLGGRLELGPLLNLYLSHILNLQDKSSVIQGRINWDIYQDTVLQFGVTEPIGSSGDEFGNVTDVLRAKIKKNSEVFMRLEFYF